MANSDFGIEKVVATSHWRVHTVPIGRDGKLYTVELCTDLLDGGASRTQDEWAKFSKAELNAGRYGYLSAPQIRGLVHVCRINKDNPKYDSSIREIQEFLKRQFSKHFLVTNSRVDYMPSGQDVVTYEYGLDGEHQVKATILGPDEYIIKTKNPQGYHILFDTNDDPKEINSDFVYLNGTNAYAWKVNSKPESKETRVVRFYAYPGGFDVFCDRDPQDSYSVFGGKVFVEGDAPKTKQ